MTDPITQIDQCLAAGDFAGALGVADAAAAATPDDPELHFYRGAALASLRRPADALDAFDRALKLDPEQHDYHYERAGALIQLGRPDEAVEALDEALKRRPNEPDFLIGKAEALASAGRFREAFDLLDPRIEQGERTPAAVIAWARVARRFDRAEDAEQRLAELCAQSGIDPVQRIRAGFERGRILHHLARYDDAFRVYDDANQQVGAKIDIPAREKFADEIVSAWTAERVGSLPRATVPGADAARPVFIVGMPRSGTSLIEQIIAAHPDAAGAGETSIIPDVFAELMFQAPSYTDAVNALDPARLSQAAAHIIARLRTHDRSAQRITEKLPTNYLHLGLINLLFPKARVIHCTRNPLDAGLSCYFQFFAAHHDFAYDLESIGATHRLYQRLMDHWKSVLDIAILDVAYEDVVADLEGQTRRILDFIDLPWNDACLRYHESGRTVASASNEQVREPIYKTSVDVHKHYDAHIAPLKRALDG